MFRNDWQRTICDLIKSQKGPTDCLHCPYLIDKERGLCVANAHYDGLDWIRDNREGEVIDN